MQLLKVWVLVGVAVWGLGIVLLSMLLRTTTTNIKIDGLNTTVNTNLTIVNTNMNVNGVNNSTVRTVTHRPRTSKSVHVGVVVTTTLVRNITLLTMIIYLLMFFLWYAVCRLPFAVYPYDVATRPGYGSWVIG